MSEEAKMKKLVLIGLMLVGLVSSVFGKAIIKDISDPQGAGKLLVNKHFNEYDSKENPVGYWWCGHTALKVAMYSESRKSDYKNLEDIHNTFSKNDVTGLYNNNRICGWKKCSTYQDLEYALTTDYKYYGSYGKYPNNYTDFFNKVKVSINNGHPIIVPWPYKYSVGHFWVIVGYKNYTNSSKNVIYLRDVNKRTPKYGYWDVKVNPHTFWSEGYNNGGGSMHMLFVIK